MAHVVESALAACALLMAVVALQGCGTKDSSDVGESRQQQRRGEQQQRRLGKKQPHHQHNCDWSQANFEKTADQSAYAIWACNGSTFKLEAEEGTSFSMIAETPSALFCQSTERAYRHACGVVQAFDGNISGKQGKVFKSLYDGFIKFKAPMIFVGRNMLHPDPAEHQTPELVASCQYQEWSQKRGEYISAYKDLLCSTDFFVTHWMGVAPASPYNKLIGTLNEPADRDSMRKNMTCPELKDEFLSVCDSAKQDRKASLDLFSNFLRKIQV